jgi:O-antigen ligase
MRRITFALSLIFIFSIPWEGVVELPSLGSAARIVGGTVAALWLASVVSTGRFRKPSPFHLMLFLFVLWNAVSTFWSADPESTISHAETWAQLLVMVCILWDLYTTRAGILAGLQAFVLGAYVAVGSALVNFASGNAFYSYYQRFSPSEQSNPDGFGFIVALGMPVAWHLAASKGTGKLNGLLKLVNYAYIPVAVLGISLSGTRTALIAMMPALAFGIASLTRLRLGARIAIFLLLTSAMLILLPQLQGLRSFQRFGTTVPELTEGDLNNRTTNWAEGLASFVEHPVVGVGADMYRSVNNLGKLAHNSFLSVLVEVGLIGFALFGTLLAIAVIEACSQPKWEAGFWLTVLAVWAIGASTLTYEFRKATWLFPSLVVASAALTRHRDEAAAVVQPDQQVKTLIWSEL